MFYWYFCWDSLVTLGVSITRVVDGLQYDFSTSTFVATPVQPTTPATEGAGPYLGSYSVVIPSLPAAQFTDGDYIFRVHDMTYLNAGQPSVVGVSGGPCKGGTFATYFPVSFPTTFTIAPTA
jgi:hypothetical protein